MSETVRAAEKFATFDDWSGRNTKVRTGYSEDAGGYGQLRAEMYLFGNLVAVRERSAREDRLRITNAGWHTTTSYDRINSVLRRLAVSVTVGRNRDRVCVWDWKNQRTWHFDTSRRHPFELLVEWKNDKAALSVNGQQL